MTKLEIYVAQHIKTRTGEDHVEAIMRSGRFVMKNGATKQQHQITPDDELAVEPVPVGRAMCVGLDATDDKATPSDLRRRFALAVRIERALKGNGMVEIDSDERRVIETACESIRNGMFLAAIEECLAHAVPVKPKAKAKADA